MLRHKQAYSASQQLKGLLERWKKSWCYSKTDYFSAAVKDRSTIYFFCTTWKKNLCLILDKISSYKISFLLNKQYVLKNKSIYICVRAKYKRKTRNLYFNIHRNYFRNCCLFLNKICVILVKKSICGGFMVVVCYDLFKLIWAFVVETFL